MSPGRPAKYSEALANSICEKLATSNRGLAHICAEEGVSTTTVFKWLKENPEFADNYARAREAQADFLADEILEIADDGSRDTKTIMKGDVAIEVEDTEWTNRSKLRVDARKWIASKLKPKKYGDKIETEHSGSVTIQQITGMEVK